MNRWLPERRAARWLLYITLFLSLLGGGRLVQKTLDSRLQGTVAPYLQSLGPDRVIIQWQTDSAERGEVWLSPEGSSSTLRITEPEPTTIHTVSITDLRPNQQYRYRVGAAGTTRWGEDGSLHFRTAPQSGSEQPVRFWVLGDPGYRAEPQQQVKEQALAWMDANPRPGQARFDLLLTTGDNAYTSGKMREFRDYFFAPYAEQMARVGVWPVYGNHDSRRWAFFDLFTFPQQGELGGVPSGTERYFAFDYGSVHFIMLDSESSDMSRDGEMAQWLKQDLAVTKQPWRIALIHHPAYSKGSHNSDDAGDSDGRLIEVRENVVPLLEQGGVDMVLYGHSHMYERSALIACHYGMSSSFDESTMLVDASSPFQVSPKGRGMIHAVVGSSAKLANGPLNHPVMQRSLHEYGSLIVDVMNEQLRAVFVNDQGKVLDEFVLSKRDRSGAVAACN